MNLSIIVVLGNLLVQMGSGATRSIDEYTFGTEDGSITMKVSFLEPYAGSPLVLYSGSGKLCFSEALGRDDCSERFVGAIALVHFYARNLNGQMIRSGKIRERVVLTAKGAGVPDRPVYTKAVDFVNGMATDIQLYGYDESAVPASDRSRVRAQSMALWVQFRQELYWNSEEKPFVIINWRHSIEEIRLICIAADKGSVRRSLPVCP